jgi:hypothetical protein
MALNILSPKSETQGLIPVAPDAAMRKIRLTRIEKTTGQWVYGGEIELLEVPNAPRDLTIEHPGEETQLLTTHLVCREIVAVAGTPVSDSDNAVVCCFPYSLDWYSWSAFKRGTDKKADKVKLQISKSEDFGEALHEWPFDPFETSGKRLTARFIEYARTNGLAVTAKHRAANGANNLHRSNLRQKFSGTKQFWLYGIVEGDLEEVVADIRNSEACVQLLEAGKDGSILSSGKYGAPPVVLFQNYDLFQEVCEVALDSSIRKALAGLPPDETSRVLWRNGGSKQVQCLLDYIFSKTIFALAQRLGAVPVTVGSEKTVRYAKSSSNAQSFEELVTERCGSLRERLSEQDRDPMASTILQTAKALLAKPDPEFGLVVVCALHRLGIIIPDDIAKLVKAARDRNADAADVYAEIIKPHRAP